MLPRIVDEPYKVHCVKHDAQRTVYVRVLYGEDGRPVIHKFNGCNDASAAPECKECAAKVYSSCSGKESATR